MKKRIMELIAVFILAGILVMNVKMPVGNAASQSSINNAIAKALVYLNSSQASDGHWGGSLFPVASTAMAVLAFENGGHYGWNSTDPYNNTVQNGLNWLFQQGTNVTMDNQTWGNPDASGTGIGVEFSSGDDPIYQTPMALMAIVASSAPTNVTQPGPLGVRTYHDIAADIVDFLAWAQVDLGSGEGGWTYNPGDNYTGGADNSNSGWPTMGLLAAQLWGINASAFVKSQLSIWITTCQDLTGNSTSNANYGSFGYGSADDILGGVPEAAIGIAELTYVGAYSTNASIIAAEGYINRMWNVNDGGWNVNIGSLYAMYAVMKACREALPPIQFIANYDGTPGVEWYNGTGQYADSLIANQSAGGSWNIWEPWDESDAFSTDLSTAFGTLILEPYVVNIATKYTLTVTVEDATNNNPITGAAVQAVGPESMSGSTLSNGQITFISVQAGTYLVNASASGYLPSGTTVSVTSNTAVTIKLSPTTVTPPPPPKPVGGKIEPIDTPAVLLAAAEDYAKYWIALLAVSAIAALIIFKRRRT